MAFTGTASTTRTGKNSVLITGLSLGTSATGTIGNYGDTGADVQLPAGIALHADDTEVSLHEIATSLLAIQLAWDVAGTPLRVSVINGDGANATVGLNIRIENLHSIAK